MNEYWSDKSCDVNEIVQSQQKKMEKRWVYCCIVWVRIHTPPRLLFIQTYSLPLFGPIFLPSLAPILLSFLWNE